MKSLLFSIAMLCLCTFLKGQEKSTDMVRSGKITFEEKIKLEIKLEGEAAQFADMLPKERKSEKVLFFNEKATLFEDGVDVSNDMNAQHAEGVVIRMGGSGQNKIYTDLATNKLIDQRDFMNRVFLVEKEIPEMGWKVTGNQKQILGYTCMEAVNQDTAGIRTVVWFTPAINIKSGPAGFCNLPGMILEADINAGTRTYIAKAVDIDDAQAIKVTKPKEGKKVTDAEYKAIVSEKMKEMGVEEGAAGAAGAHVRIIIKN